MRILITGATGFFGRNFLSSFYFVQNSSVYNFSVTSLIRNKINFYDHFTHLLVHSFLHINGYMHKRAKDFIKMQKAEIEILNKIGLQNPY